MYVKKAAAKKAAAKKAGVEKAGVEMAGVEMAAWVLLKKTRADPPSGTPEKLNCVSLFMKTAHNILPISSRVILNLAATADDAGWGVRPRLQSAATVRRVLVKLIDAGLVERSGNRYRLTDAGRAAAEALRR